MAQVNMIPEAGNEFQRRTFQLLGAWIRQRPGLEWQNYGNPTAYRSEVRRILRQLHDAERLLAACSWRTFTDEQIRDAFRSYSGRLTLHLDANGLPDHLEYCTGQYWPTEYRAVVCAVLGSLLFRRFVDDYMETGNAIQRDRPGHFAREALRKEFGRRIQNTWMD